MKSFTKTQINPIHRDLLIALGTGFTMAFLIVSAIVSIIA